MIVGAGVAGLSLAYFLEKEGIDNIIVIDRKGKIGTPVKDTGLVSDAILSLLPFEKKSVITTFRRATLHNLTDSIELLTIKRKMLLVDRELFDKLIFQKLKSSKVFLKRSLLKVTPTKNLAITNKEKIKYKVIVDASGPFSVVRRFYNLPNSSFVIGMEGEKEFEGKSNEINIYIDKTTSNSYFGWILKYNSRIKVGLIDDSLKYSKFERFAKSKGIWNFEHFYADVIKNKPEKEIVKENLLCVGESSGYLKQFSLGGIVFGVIQAKIASQIIKEHLDEKTPLKAYEVLAKKIFWKGNLFSNLVRLLLKKREIFKLIKMLRLNKLTYYLDLDTYLPENLCDKVT